MPLERFGELKVRSVVGVGEEDPLSVRHVLLQDVRVDGGNQNVVPAVHHECGVVVALEMTEADG